MTKANITAERLRELVHYDPETGLFTWRIQSGRQPAGSRTGWNQNGYIAMKVDKHRLMAHRAAWLYMTGSFPACQIDHINGDPLDNRFCNLRDVSDLHNKHNMRAPKRTNTSGFLGVAKANSRWMAKITVSRRQVYLGTFDTPELAHAAYLAAKRALHSTCTI